MPPHETITGYARDVSTLTGAQLERINRVAEFIARTWPGTAAITSVRVTGYFNRDERQPGLSARRASAVRDALLSALNRARPGLATRIRWVTEDRGLSTMPKVEIYLWAGPTPPPVPLLVRVPSSAELPPPRLPVRPETPEERIRRILRAVPLVPQRSFSQMFWNRVDEQLNSAMSRMNVPQSLRGLIREGAHKAISSSSEALLNQVVGATGLSSTAQDAIRSTVRALLQVPIR